MKLRFFKRLITEKANWNKSCKVKVYSCLFYFLQHSNKLPSLILILSAFNSSFPQFYKHPAESAFYTLPNRASFFL